ncbi:MAG: circularly permuted type 2 ATP-grasp protein [Acidobacteria bacterium]|nr:circularly permuted type 2 ATP-grasp protein [Acidobacteriota bacterium]
MISEAAGFGLRLENYSPLTHHFDEMVGADGAPRSHWARVVNFLSSLNREGLAHRWDEGRRVIQQNGITYNVYGDPLSVDRPWPLDPIPLILDPAEWASIEAAIIQRATLLNAILKDLYGPQRLLYDRQLPAELVLAHPSYLRQCHGVMQPGGSFLHLYAADLARSPDGKWWVIADRAQAPSGTGYALENRMVSNRTMPDLLSRSNVRPLEEFFQTLMRTLLEIAPSHRENPRVVLLTPGPYNETYFEHALLARRLGISLVEGGDLVVRDRRVFLKTLGGLLPVDVILRRQDDSFCDPLELRADSLLGVPGLLQAIRDGHVAVANMLGSGVAETAALSAFLPGLCKHLLSEELKMPSVATWWCGQDVPKQYVLDHPGGLVIKPALRARREPPVFIDKLSDADRRQFLAKLKSRPQEYVAQEQVALGTTPVWNSHGLLPRHFVLRVHAVATRGTYAVLPGGLTRFSASKDSLVVSVQSGGGSKDAWVLSKGPVPPMPPPQPRSLVTDINRATFDLPSRVADNLFWMGRYAERVDFGIRLVRGGLVRVARESRTNQDLSAICDVLQGLGYLEDPEARLEVSILAKELDTLVTDPERRGGLLWTLNKMHRLGWLLRDRISADTWLVLSRLTQKFVEPLPGDPFRRSAAIDLLDRSILRLSAFSGYVMEAMTRGAGWAFLDIGRRLERAVQVLEMLRFGLALGVEDNEADRLEALLEVSDSIITYRSRYMSSMQPELVVDLLLLDEANPRSVAFQLARLQEHIERLPGAADLRTRPEYKTGLEAMSKVRLVELDHLMGLDRRGRRTRLQVLLRSVANNLQQLSEQLNRAYLIHALPIRQATQG